MRKRNINRIKVLSGDTARYSASVLYFRKMGASHFYILKGVFKGIVGDLMVAFKNVRDADAFLPEAKRWGIIKDNALRIVSEEAEAIESIQVLLN